MLPISQKCTKYIQQKHGVTITEIQAWLEKYGFTVNRIFSDHSGKPYTPGSDRIIFWAANDALTILLPSSTLAVPVQHKHFGPCLCIS